MSDHKEEQSKQREQKAWAVVSGGMISPWASPDDSLPIYGDENSAYMEATGDERVVPCLITWREES